MNKYIDEADELYEMANSAVNKKNTSEMLRLIREWGRNRDYYYDVYDDIDSLTDKNVKYTFFTKTQYSNLKLYVLSCMLPAETIYNMFYEKKLSNKETRNIRNNWSRRENLESGVKKSVSDADDIIEFYDANHAKLAKDANTYHQNLKDLFIGMTPSEGGAAGGGNNESKEGTVNL